MFGIQPAIHAIVGTPMAALPPLLVQGGVSHPGLGLTTIPGMVPGYQAAVPAQPAPTVAPQMAGPQLAPQGVIGNAIGQLAPLLPFQAGPQLAPQGAIGNVIGQLAPLLPFQAGPQIAVPQLAPQLAPQGVFGSTLGSTLGGAIGNAFGQGALGQTIGGIAGGLLPFQAVQQPTMTNSPSSYVH